MKKMTKIIMFTFQQAIKAKWFRIITVCGIVMVIAMINSNKILEMINGDSTHSHTVYMANADSAIDSDALKAIENEFVKVNFMEENVPQEIEKMQKSRSDKDIIVDFNGETANMYYQSNVDEQHLAHVVSGLQQIIQVHVASGLNLGTEDISKLFSDSSIELVECVSDDAHGGNLMLVLILIVIIYMLIMIYGTMIANSVVEEKTNRIIETLLCYAKPMELLFGKILGILSITVLQIAIFTGTFFVTIQITPIEKGSMLDVEMINDPKTIVMMVAFCMTGYLMYAFAFAALGAFADNAQDSTQLLMPMTVMMLIVYGASMWGISNASSTMTGILSYAPFFSPILFFSKAIVIGTTWSQIISVILVQVMTVLAIGYVSSRIYRIGAISYGFSPKMLLKKRSTKALEETRVL